MTGNKMYGRNGSILAIILIHLFCQIYCANVSVFGDDNVVTDFRASELATHIELCRLSGMCLERKIQNHMCCAQCNCEPSCNKTGFCCPDFIKIDAFGDGANMTVIEQSCIPLELGNTNKYHKQGVFGYLKCPNGPLHLKKMCEIEYKSKETTLSDMVPCVSNKTNTYYRNKHCALCHGEIEKHLDYLTAVMICQNLPFSEEIEIKRSVLETENCTIVFEKDQERPYGFEENSCRTSIDRCNVTGLWTEYDSELEHACNMNHSVIRFPQDNLRFQNIFCFLCNGLKVNTLIPRCIDFTSATFSFSGLLKIDTPKSPVSNGSTILQPEEENEVYCPGRRIFQNGQCVLNIKWYDNYAVSVKVKLIPLHMFAQPKETTVKRLIDILNTKLGNISDDKLCLFNVWTVYVLALSSQETRSLWFSIDVDLSYYVTGKLQLEVFSIDTVSALHNLEILDGDNHVYQVKVVDTFGNYDNQVFLFRDNLRCNLWPDIMCFPCRREGHIFDLMDFLPCPRIDFSLNNKHWKRTYDGVFHLSNNFAIDTDKYIDINTGVIGLCYKTYMEYMNNISRVTWSTDQLVSLVCIIFSLVCVILSLVAYTLLPKLRLNTPGKNVMTLIIALLTAQALYIVGSFGQLEGDSKPCKAVGILSHFSWLMVVMWMNICTIHMYRVFRKTQIILSEPREYCFYHVYAFTVSAICVGMNIIISINVNNDIGYGYTVCYINVQENVIYTFLIPVCLVIVLNFAMFIIVIIRIRNSEIERHVQNDRNELVIFVKLSTITGMTWIFGIIYSFTDNVVFSYLFIVLNASQGVFLFFAFVVNKQVLGMILERFKKRSIETYTRPSRTTSSGDAFVRQ